MNLQGIIQSATNAVSELFSVSSPDALLNRHLGDFLTATSLTPITEHHQWLINSRQPQSFEEIWELHDHRRYVFLSQYSLFYSAEGTVIAIWVNATDITAIKNNLQHVTEEKKITALYLKNIVTHLADHVFWEDREGRVLGCNDQQAINVGLKKAEDLVGKTIDDIAHLLKWEPHLTENLRRNDLKVMHENKIITVEEEVRWTEGTNRTYLSKKAPLIDEEGQCIGMLGLAFDITEQKIIETQLREAKEQAEITNIAKSNFIANISHDLRTPLHTMLGIAELLQIKQHYPEQEDLIEGIIQSGQSLLQLVEQILQFSELESRHEDIQFENLDLRQLIENIILEHVGKIKSKNIDLIISYCENTPHLVKSNAQYLRRIICNLIGNSIKFTQGGYILVAVETVELFKDRATLQIIVEDTGIGIASHEIQHIFERFYRSDPSYTGKHKGCGLGLAIAKQLTERLDGKLSVNSQLGIGTTFSCTITFILANTTMDYFKLENEFLDADILIIDDHAKRREALLRQLPCKKKLALTSEKAVDLFAEKKVFFSHNLIIIDSEIKAIQPEALAKLIHFCNKESILPMLVLVSKMQNNQILSHPNSYFQQYLSKPIQPTEINHRLAPTWKKWRESQQRRTHKPIQHALSVLVVEDEPLIQKFTRAILIEFGCDVCIAKNGQEALLQSQRQFNLIFMDIGLPDMSGLDVTQWIRSNSNNKTTPIIALTAHVSEEDKARCLNAGVNDFLTKPASYANFKKLLVKYR